MRNESKLIEKRKNNPTVVVKMSARVGRNAETLLDFSEFTKEKNTEIVPKKVFRQYIGASPSRESELNVTIEMDGQEKTMRVSEEMHFRMSFDLTPDFDEYNRKDPTFNKLKEVCESYIQHAIKKIT